VCLAVLGFVSYILYWPCSKLARLQSTTDQVEIDLCLCCGRSCCICDYSCHLWLLLPVRPSWSHERLAPCFTWHKAENIIFSSSIMLSIFFEPKTAREAPAVKFLLIKEKKRKLTRIYRVVWTRLEKKGNWHLFKAERSREELSREEGKN